MISVCGILHHCELLFLILIFRTFDDTGTEVKYASGHMCTDQSCSTCSSVSCMTICISGYERKCKNVTKVKKNKDNNKLSLIHI